VGGQNKAKAQQYRNSEKGHEARKMYEQQPQVKAQKAARAAVKRHLQGKA
jgi:hypothetical protein